MQEDEACGEANAQLAAAIAAMQGIEDVILVGRWTYYADGTGVGIDAHNTIEMTLTETGESGIQVYDQAVENTVATLGQGRRRVHVMRQVPEIQYYDSRKVARALVHGRLGPGPDLDARTGLSPYGGRGAQRKGRGSFPPAGGRGPHRLSGRLALYMYGRVVFCDAGGAVLVF